MKKISFLLSLFVCISLYAQDSNQTPKDSIWTTGGSFSFLVNQSAFNADWQGGGTSNYSGNIVINYDINYEKDAYSWDTKFLADYGITKTKKQEFYRKTSDRFEVNSILGRQIQESNWFASALLNFKTQLDKGYTFEDDTDTGEEVRETETQFMSPAYTQLALGALWKKGNDLKVNISPVSGRVITANKRFTTTPGYEDGDFFGLDQGKAARYEFGASINAYGKFKLMENISMENILALYSNYIEDPLNVDIDYTMNLVLKVNQYISTNLTFQAIYDDNAAKGFQVREVLGVGVSFDL
ncbi:MAG: DUF3078 domain-containing protein [Flavobacteriaceae bacterium]